jgi:hypothetical protein
MANMIFDRIAEVSATTGTGSFALGGAVSAAYRAFQTKFSVSDTPLYLAQAVDGSGTPTGQWETGRGTLTGITTLARSTIFDNSSNNTSPISFTGGNLQIWCVLPANLFKMIPGFADCPVVNTNHTFASADVNCLLRHTDTSNYTWTIDTFANSGIGEGNVITGTCENTGTITIVAPSGGSLIRLDSTAGTGNRTIGAYGMFTLMNLDGANSWGITGTGVS